MADERLSLQEAADRCGMAYRTLRAMVLRGDLPAEKRGQAYRLRTDDVDAFIERSRVQPGQLASAPSIPPAPPPSGV